MLHDNYFNPICGCAERNGMVKHYLLKCAPYEEKRPNEKGEDRRDEGE